MLKLEYDERGRIVLPFYRCGKRINISAHAETYCMFAAEHDGECGPPPVSTKKIGPILVHGRGELVFQDAKK